MSKGDLQWEARFQELVEYKRVHGNCNVSHAYKANPQLGMWVSTQRRRKQIMSEERQKRLNSIGFTWTVLGLGDKTKTNNSEVRFQQLVEYKRVHGNCNVPYAYKANPQLGMWVSTQRRRKQIMSEERRKRLSSIGFVWNFREAQYTFHWKVRFQQLVEYKRVHGNCNVPHTRKYKANPQLGRWVSLQRSNKETMSERKRNQLNSIGFVWRLKRGIPKQQPRVRPSTVEDPEKKKARVDEEAAQKDTGFQPKSWDSNFEQLCDFVRTYKHCNVPAQHPELGRWAEEQRQLYEWKQIGKGTRSLLTDEREAKLMAVGFGFETFSPEGGGGEVQRNTYFSAQSCIPDEPFSYSRLL